MPPKRYQSRFPTARIKKIMQLDDDVGKVASSVPLLISRAVEMFLQKMLTSTADFVDSRTSKTITASHMKYIINHEPLFHFLREEAANVPDVVEGSDEPGDGKKKRGRKRTEPGAAKQSGSDLSEPKRKKKISPKKEVERETDNNIEDHEPEQDLKEAKTWHRKKVIVSSDKQSTGSQRKTGKTQLSGVGVDIPTPTQSGKQSLSTSPADVMMVADSQAINDSPVPMTVIKSVPNPLTSFQHTEQTQN